MTDLPYVVHIYKVVMFHVPSSGYVKDTLFHEVAIIGVADGSLPDYQTVRF